MGPALGIIAVSYSGCDKVWTVAGFTIGMTLMGTYVSSLQVNPLDLSPNYAGMLTAIVGTIGSLFGIVAPKIVDVMLPNVCSTNIILREHGLKIICLNLIHFTTYTHAHTLPNDF